MDKNIDLEKRKRIFMGLYNSSHGISTLALAIVAAFEVLMIVYSFLNQELYGPYLTKYRLFYISLLVVALIYISLNIYAKKDMANRYKILTIANPVCAIFFFGWALTLTYSDSLVTGAADPSVFMTFSMVVPLGFSLFPYVYAIIVILADSLMLY